MPYPDRIRRCDCATNVLYGGAPHQFETKLDEPEQESEQLRAPLAIPSLSAKLDEIALEFASGAFRHLVTHERIEQHYAPLLRELLDHGVEAALSALECTAVRPAFRCGSCEDVVEIEWKFCAWCGGGADWIPTVIVAEERG